MIMILTTGWGLQQRPTSPIKKKYSALKMKIDNEFNTSMCIGEASDDKVD